MPDIVNEIQSIFKLKSILGIFIGIFCIVCLRKLITLGVRWKKVLLNWGYRTVNVPSLWIPDAHGPGDTDRISSSKTPTSSPYLSNGEVPSFGADDDPQGSLVSVTGPGQRVPALRLPDAWPNFLLTWLHLNLDTLSILGSAWLTAVNDELSDTDPVKSSPSEGNDNKSNQQPSPVKFRLELTGIHQSHSVPPQFSCIETSASGSTKELHFRCTLFSPEVCLVLQLVRPTGANGAKASSKSPVPITLLLHMKQASCRLKLVCLAVEKVGTVALSWDLISPLVMDDLHVLTADDQPVTTELSKGELRWLKDTVYLAIQKAVPNVLLKSSVEVCDRSRTPRWIPDKCVPESNLILPRSLVHPYPEDSISKWLTDALSSGPPVRLAGRPGLHLRVITAILLEPSADGHLVQSLGQLGELLHCAVRSNTSWAKAEEQEGELDSNRPQSPTVRTPGARLELKPWPTSAHNSTADKLRLPKQVTVNGLAYMAIWNYDALLPLESSGFNLLDVCLFTEAADDSASHTTSFSPGSSTLFGSAVLPLSTGLSTINRGTGVAEPSGAASSSAPTQHVVLVDCQVTRRPNWTIDGPEQQHEEQVSSRAVKFMILLRAQLVTDPVQHKPAGSDLQRQVVNVVEARRDVGVHSEQTVPLNAAEIPSAPTRQPCDHLQAPMPSNQLVAGRSDALSSVRLRARFPNNSTAAWQRPSNEQLAEFMSDTVPYPPAVSSLSQAAVHQGSVPLDRSLAVNTATGASIEYSPSPSSAEGILRSGRSGATSTASSAAQPGKPKKLFTRFFSFRQSKRKRADISSSFQDSPNSAQSAAAAGDSRRNNQAGVVVRSSDSFPRSAKPRFFRAFTSFRKSKQ